MWGRCTIKSNTSYPNYGGRGIKVCERWESFENFHTDMGDRPPGMTLDRMRGDEDYSPGNCKWSTSKEQNNNRRNNVFVTMNGKTQTYSQWADETGIKANVLRERFLKQGNFEPIKRKKRSTK